MPRKPARAENIASSTAQMARTPATATSHCAGFGGNVTEVAAMRPLVHSIGSHMPWVRAVLGATDRRR